MSKNSAPELITTGDGSHTLYVPELMENYHSRFGAETESRHIFIGGGFHFLSHLLEVKILEIGFGTGLNAFLSLLESKQKGIKVFYTSLEKYPLSSEMASCLNYGMRLGLPEQFLEMHNADWNKTVEMNSDFKILKLEVDFITFKPEGSYHLIYFDAFAPEVQPEMWTYEIFKGLFDCLLPGGVLVTYSAKGIVKQALRNAGFNVKRLPGPPGKRHFLRALKA
jgi:tRNA U34 5-methylaminomethyl-2-thiouridine-forming methyltransferase MnmC